MQRSRRIDFTSEIVRSREKRRKALTRNLSQERRICHESSRLRLRFSVQRSDVFVIVLVSLRFVIPRILKSCLVSTSLRAVVPRSMSCKAYARLANVIGTYSSWYYLRNTLSHYYFQMTGFVKTKDAKKVAMALMLIQRDYGVRISITHTSLSKAHKFHLIILLNCNEMNTKLALRARTQVRTDRSQLDSVHGGGRV